MWSLAAGWHPSTRGVGHECRHRWAAGPCLCNPFPPPEAAQRTQAGPDLSCQGCYLMASNFFHLLLLHTISISNLDDRPTPRRPPGIPAGYLLPQAVGGQGGGGLLGQPPRGHGGRGARLSVWRARGGGAALALHLAWRPRCAQYRFMRVHSLLRTCCTSACLHACARPWDLAHEHKLFAYPRHSSPWAPQVSSSNFPLAWGWVLMSVSALCAGWRRHHARSVCGAGPSAGPGPAAGVWQPVCLVVQRCSGAWPVQLG